MGGSIDMTKKTLSARKAWLFSAAAAVIGLSPALAQDATIEAQTPVDSGEIVVPGEIIYRNRSDETAPVLEYGLDYFQRFEPLTVGDALKRVPSVAFLSDVLESDGVRLRGLDPAYTQILINGEQVPGSGDSSGSFGNGADSSFFVDRIPAELIERVEIMRSPSANRSGDAVAGALNIVMRDSYSLEGGYIRAGLLYFQNDEHWGETLGGVWSGAVGPGRLLIGANLQDRHNPKDKLSLRFDAPGGALDNNEIQTDVRDGTDYSGNFSYSLPAFGDGELRFDGFYVHTERTQNEDSTEYTAGVVQPDQIETLNNNDLDIEQDSWSLNARADIPMAGGETRVKLGYASFENSSHEFEDETDFQRGGGGPFPEADRFTGEIEDIELDDSEFKAKLEHSRDFGAGEIEFGLQYEDKERDNDVRATDDDTRLRTNLPNGTQSTTARPPGIVGPGPDALILSRSTTQRERLDPYVMYSGSGDGLAWEFGLRYETTKLTIEERNPTTDAKTESETEILLPSINLKRDLGENDRLSFSIARTVRNPSFELLNPTLLLAELGDNDFEGNPLLRPEKAWGADLGIEHRIGRSGIAGANLFYRDITDVIEIYNTGVAGSEDDAFVYSARNTGKGKVWGIELDVSAPLTFIGMENTGVFMNYSWLDSEINDEFGERHFNSQATSIFNIGFIQDIPSWAASFGATYRKQGDAFSRVVGEEVTTTYGADLEVFLEKRFGESFTMRLTGSNLLDANKDEVFNKFVTAQDQVDRSFDEFELENESAGPWFQLIGRYAF
jgi:outer membrane receptor protein involved in Fe transport